jgi:hypothetical protein
MSAVMLSALIPGWMPAHQILKTRTDGIGCMSHLQIRKFIKGRKNRLL